LALPKLTPEEKLRALKKAQEMRSQRARIRQELKTGQIFALFSNKILMM
jgi:hypothetical protein